MVPLPPVRATSTPDTAVRAALLGGFIGFLGCGTSSGGSGSGSSTGSGGSSGACGSPPSATGGTTGSAGATGSAGTTSNYAVAFELAVP